MPNSNSHTRKRRVERVLYAESYHSPGLALLPDALTPVEGFSLVEAFVTKVGIVKRTNTDGTTEELHFQEIRAYTREVGAPAIGRSATDNLAR